MLASIWLCVHGAWRDGAHSRVGRIQSFQHIHFQLGKLCTIVSSTNIAKHFVVQFGYAFLLHIYANPITHAYKGTPTRPDTHILITIIIPLLQVCHQILVLYSSSYIEAPVDDAAFPRDQTLVVPAAPGTNHHLFDAYFDTFPCCPIYITVVLSSAELSVLPARITPTASHGHHNLSECPDSVVIDRHSFTTIVWSHSNTYTQMGRRFRRRIAEAWHSKSGGHQRSWPG